MSTQGAPGRAPNRPSTSAMDVATSLRTAFAHLARAARASGLTANGLAPGRLPAADRTGWVDALSHATEDGRAVVLHVTPSAILLGDLPVADGAERNLAEGLYAAGVRSITLFPGASPGELAALGALLAISWSAAGASAFADAAWRADLAHLHLDFVDSLDDPTQPAATPAPFAALAALAALGRAPNEGQQRGTLGADALEALRQLRDSATPDPTSFLDVHPTAGVLPAELVAAVALVRDGTDLQTAELGRALVAGIANATNAPTAARVAREVVSSTVELLGSTLDPTPLLHELLLQADPDLGVERVQVAVRAAVPELGRDPLRALLLSRLPPVATQELRGQLFSLLSLPLSEVDVGALAPVLPRWAVQVLADTQLLRETEESNAHLERVRVRLGSEQPAVLSLGLAMAARLDDARLLDAILRLAGHPLAGVRESALFALRQQTGRKVRALVVQQLTDTAPDVRVEALRYAVAHGLPEVLPYLEQRICDPSLEALHEPEIRALCIAFGRVARERAEPTLSELALGRRRAGHPALARFALHGLRAIGTPRARAALQHIAVENPRLRHEAESLLAGDAR